MLLALSFERSFDDPKGGNFVFATRSLDRAMMSGVLPCSAVRRYTQMSRMSLQGRTRLMANSLT
jgi:hypothetical protein